jgi:hypothetical protein
VATALVLVGGVLVALPAFMWLCVATLSSAGASRELLTATVPIATLGLVFIAVAVVFSFRSHSVPEDSD